MTALDVTDGVGRACRLWTTVHRIRVVGGAHAERAVLYPWLLDWPVGRSDEFLELAGCRPTRAAGPGRSLRVLDGLDAGAGDPSWRGLSALVRCLPWRKVGPNRRRGVGVMAKTSGNA